MTTEKDLESIDFLKQLDSFYNSGVEGYFEGEKGIKIYYKYFLQNDLPDENGSITIVNGRGESTLKYKELVFDLFKNGYSVYIYDHRGQGLSQRIYTDDIQMSYVDKFEYYVSDLKRFYSDFISKSDHKKKYILAHSMGSTVATKYIEDYPRDFSAAVFTSPMLGLHFPYCLIIKLFHLKSPLYAHGEKSYDEEKQEFINNFHTHSPVRYRIIRDIYENNPSAKLGGVSYQWLHQSCDIFGRLVRDIKRINIPILMILAGDEKIVSTKAQKKFYNKMRIAGRDIQKWEVDLSYHELLVEKDEFRIPIISKLLDFYQSTTD